MDRFRALFQLRQLRFVHGIDAPRVLDVLLELHDIVTAHDHSAHRQRQDISPPGPILHAAEIGSKSCRVLLLKTDVLEPTILAIVVIDLDMAIRIDAEGRRGVDFPVTVSKAIDLEDCDTEWVIE